MARRSNAAPTNVWIEGDDSYLQVGMAFVATTGTYSALANIGGVAHLSGLISQDMYCVDSLILQTTPSVELPLFMALYDTLPSVSDGAVPTTLPNPVMFLAFNSGSTRVAGIQVRSSFKTLRIGQRSTPNLYFAAFSQSGGSISAQTIKLGFAKGR